MDEPGKKSSSLLTAFRQKLIDKLATVPKVAADGANADAVRQERIAILREHEEQAGSAQEILSQLGVDIKAANEFSKGNPRKPADLLVSTQAWPFEDLSELDAHFGPLPPGFTYRYLAPRSHIIPKSVANNANNVIRIPSALNLVLDEDFQQPGDEFPDGSLADWLPSQPAETNRIWTWRMLSCLGVVEREDIPDGIPDDGSTPLAAGPALETGVVSDRSVAELIEDFSRYAQLQYDGEEKERAGDALGYMCDKKLVFNTLTSMGPDAVAALRPLLQHSDIAVRVSAATYLLGTDFQSAWPVLREAMAMFPGNEKKKHEVGACRHALQATWMRGDGKL